MVRSAAGKGSVTNGGVTNQINTGNVKQLKGAWMTRLGSGYGGRYSVEATPPVKDGIMN